MAKPHDTIRGQWPPGKIPQHAENLLYQSAMRWAFLQSGLGRTMVAQRMGVSPERVSQMLYGNAKLTIENVARLAWACGYQLGFDLRPRERAPTEKGAE